MAAEHVGPWPVLALTGPDQRIYGLLRQVVDIGAYLGAWSEEDVVRVAGMLCGGGSVTQRQLATAYGRIEELERVNNELEKELNDLTYAPVMEALEHASRVIIVSPLRARIIRDSAAGQSTGEIAQMLGMTTPAVYRHIQRAVKQAKLGSRREMFELIRSGEIAVVTKRGGM